MTNTNKLLLAFAIVASLFSLFDSSKGRLVVSGVNRSNEYQSTTTRAYPATSLTDPTQLCPDGGGVLGSVVITGANTSIINFYDGTTTSNHSLHATTTIATIPASTAAGTYTFDAIASRGLIFDQDGGNLATTTITYRCN